MRKMISWRNRGLAFAMALALLLTNVDMSLYASELGTYPEGTAVETESGSGGTETGEPDASEIEVSETETDGTESTESEADETESAETEISEIEPMETENVEPETEI